MRAMRAEAFGHAKAVHAKTLGFDEVIDLSSEKLADGVRRITEGYGATS